MLQQSRSIFFYTSVLLTPFVVMIGLPEGYEVPKFFFIAVCSGILGMLTVFSKEKTVSMPKIPILIFYASLIISTFFSSEINYSLFGNFSRHSWSIVYFISIFLLQLAYLNYFPKFNFHLVFFIVSNILCIFTFFENNSRVISTIGQPNFLGILIALGIISGAKMLFETGYSNKNSILIVISILLQILVLIKTASVSSIAVFLLGIFYICLKYKKFLILGALTFLIFGLFLLNPLLTKKATDIFKQTQNNSNLDVSDSLNIRLSLWESSFDIWTQNPKNFLIGTGPETFGLFFEKFRNQKLNYTSEWSYFFDKPHNLFVQILVEGGLISLLALFWLIYTIFIDKTNEYKIYISLSLLFFMWNWNFTYHGLMFFLMAANSKDLIKIKNSVPTRSLILILILFLIFSSILFIRNIDKYYVQNKFYLTDENTFYFNTNKPELELQGIEYFMKSSPSDLKTYLEHLKDKYQNHLVFQTEIYQIEKLLFPQESEKTKEKIRELRPDLIEWHEMFK